MREYHRVRNRLKAHIIRNNLELFETIEKQFQEYRKHIPHIRKGPWHSTEGKQVIRLWRDRVGYSKGTVDQDLYYNALKHYRELIRTKY